jgi:hypothetical protein
MLNLKGLFNQKKQKDKIEKKEIDFEEIKKFYMMLVKYKNSHPLFNLKFVMLQVYPNLKWNQFISKLNL